MYGGMGREREQKAGGKRIGGRDREKGKQGEGGGREGERENFVERRWKNDGGNSFSRRTTGA